MSQNEQQSRDPMQSRGMSPQERKHFWFAMILIFACVFSLPLMGAIWILLMRWGVLARP